MASAETARLIAELILQDKQFRAALGRAERGVGKLENRFGRMQRNVSKGARNAGRNIERGVVLGVTAGVGALAFAVHEASQQESAIVGISKTVAGNIDGVVDELKKMSTEMPSSFEELAGIAELGGAMGVAKDDLVAFTKQVAILGSTTNVNVEDAATALGQMQVIIGLTADEFDNFTASLVDLGNKGNSTEAQILEIARRAGGAAKLFGVAKEETLGWAAAAANLGLGDELAGTALQKFFVTARKFVARGDKDFLRLAETAGMTGKEFKRAFKKDAGGAIRELVIGLSKLPEGKRILRIEELFGKGSGMTRLLVGLSGDVDNLNDSLDTSRTAWIEGTAAQAEAEKRFATSESMFKRLNNAVSLAAATLGAELLPVLVDLSKEGIAWLTAPATTKALKSFAKDLGAGARDAVKWLKSLDWDGIANALRTAAGFGKDLVNAFLGMPDWVKAAVLTGWGLNKLTGGALTDILGDTIKIAFDQFLGKGASPANPLWVATVGGGLGGGGAPVPGGGAGGGLRGALGKGVKVFGTVGLVAANLVLWQKVVDEFSSLQTFLKTGQTTINERIAEIAPALTSAEATANLKAVVSGVLGQNPFAQLLTPLVAGGQLTADFEVAANAIRKDQTLSRTEIVAALEALKQAEDLARDAGLKTPTLDAAIKDLTARLAKMPTADPKGGAAPRHDPGKGGVGTIPPRVLKPVAVNTQATKNAIDNARSIASRENDQTKTAVQNTRNAIRNAQSIGSRENAAIKFAQVTTTGATRQVAPPIVATLMAGFAGMMATMWAARPVINSNTVVNSYSTSQRGGTTTGSRGGTGGTAGGTIGGLPSGIR